MGMYTEMNLTFGLVKDVPREVVSALTIMVHRHEYDNNIKLPDHPFFKTQRWSWMLHSASFYHTPMACAIMEKNGVDGCLYFHTSCNLKNYGNEIELFIDWIAPYIQAGYNFIGYSIYEEDTEPTLYYREQLVKEKT